MTLLAVVVIVLAALYLLALGLLALFAPARARLFLGGFVNSARAHYGEVLLRLIIAAALLQHAPQMLWADLLRALGWLLLITTVPLLLLPWRWHQRFARWSVPQALRYLPLIGVASLLFGLAILHALASGPGFAG